MYIFKWKGIVLSGLERKNVLEFVSFMRPKIALFITGITASGYLLFNSIDTKLIHVILTSFFASIAGYSYNLLKDKEEDLINHKRLNLFVVNRTGNYLVIAFVIISAFFSFFLSTISLLLYFILIITAFTYSYFKIKNVFPFKNIYTGFIIGLMFLLGATANSVISNVMIAYYILISLHVFTLSLISDLRDYRGDKYAGIKTVPVMMGYEFGKKVAASLLILFLMIALTLNMKGLYPLIPFVFLILLYVYKNRPKAAHLLLMKSFAIWPGALLFLGGI